MRVNLKERFIERLTKISKYLSNDIGVDLGTANTLVYIKGKGVIINEPSVVAVNNKTGRIVAIGSSAKKMLGRTPTHINAIRPIVDGVISDFEVTEEMMSFLLSTAEKDKKTILGPRVVLGVPLNTTEVETRAVKDVAKSAGARNVYLVEQPMAAAIGIKLPIHEPLGNMVVDIGGGTTGIAIISLGGIVKSKNLKVAGDKLNIDIIDYIRSEFKVLIGEKTAEAVKIAIGTIAENTDSSETLIKGRDMATGLPREVVITGRDIKEALLPSVSLILESVREILEETPPEIVADVMVRGIHLVGGGALLRGLADTMTSYVGIPVIVDEDPLTAVVRGTSIILEDMEKFRDILVKDDYELEN